MRPEPSVIWLLGQRRTNLLTFLGAELGSAEEQVINEKEKLLQTLECYKY